MSSPVFWGKPPRKPSIRLQTVMENLRPLISETTVTSRRMPAAAIWVSANRVAIPAGLPRPISSSSSGSAAFLTHSWRRCRRVPYNDLRNSGTEVLNATDLQQGFSGGPRLDLIHHGDDGNDLEVSYFQIDGWDSVASIGPTPNDWLVMRAPGGFLQTQDDNATQQ